MLNIDLTRSLPHNQPYEIARIWPGDKLHEALCALDDLHLTIRFENHFVIEPAIQYSFQAHYLVDATNKKGEHVARGFELDNETNEWYRSISELQTLNRLVS